MGVEGRPLGEVVVAETQGGADHMPVPKQPTTRWDCARN